MIPHKGAGMALFNEVAYYTASAMDVTAPLFVDETKKQTMNMVSVVK